MSVTDKRQTQGGSQITIALNCTVILDASQKVTCHLYIKLCLLILV